MVTRFEQFCSAIASVQRNIQKIERVEMAKYGLKGPHCTCMVAMSRHPEGITAARLCEICDKDKAAISRTVSELERAGMVHRDDPDGKRYRSVLKLSEKGREIAARVNELVFVAVSKASAGYDMETQQTFVRVLSLIAGNLNNLCRDGLDILI